jgi:hypothetical protein
MKSLCSGLSPSHLRRRCACPSAKLSRVTIWNPDTLDKTFKKNVPVHTMYVLVKDFYTGMYMVCTSIGYHLYWVYPYRFFLEKYRIFLQTPNPNKKTQNPKLKTLNPKLQTKKTVWRKIRYFSRKIRFLLCTGLLWAFLPPTGRRPIVVNRK